MVRAIGAPEAKHLFALAHSVGGVDLVWVGRFGVRVRVRVRARARVKVRVRARARARVRVKVRVGVGVGARVSGC
jgi:hypothetical protein